MTHTLSGLACTCSGMGTSSFLTTDACVGSLRSSTCDPRPRSVLHPLRLHANAKASWWRWCWFQASCWFRGRVGRCGCVAYRPVCLLFLGSVSHPHAWIVPYVLHHPFPFLSLSFPSPVSDATVGMDVDHPASGCKPNHPIEGSKGTEGA